MALNKILFILLFTTFCNYLYSQNLYKIEENDLYGYIDSNGKKRIKCKYSFAYEDTIRNFGFVADKGRIICFDNTGKKLFYVFRFDNGPDYIKEGLFRIENKKGLIGFADSLGNIIIKPQYKAAFPFINGKAKVTYKGTKLEVPDSKGEYHYWDSNDWFFIDNPIKELK